MKKTFIVLTFLATMLLWGSKPSEGVEVMVTADTALIFMSGPTAEYQTTVRVVNNGPELNSSIISWYNDFSIDDCFWVSQTTDESFCCVGDGNFARLTRTISRTCPWSAHCETYGYAAGADDYAFSNCVEYTCPGGGPEVETPPPNSPIILSIGDQRIELTDLPGGVRFDLDRDGVAEQVSWTAPGGDEAFLFLDRNRNRIVDDGGELFGDATSQLESSNPNGFLALAMFDTSRRGGNSDGTISEEDPIFSSLRLWLDSNHDGVSQESELYSLTDHGIEKISLKYVETARRDKYGNQFLYRSSAVRSNGGKVPVWDVFLLREEESSEQSTKGLGTVANEPGPREGGEGSRPQAE